LEFLKWKNARCGESDSAKHAGAQGVYLIEGKPMRQPIGVGIPLQDFTLAK